MDRSKKQWIALVLAVQLCSVCGAIASTPDYNNQLSELKESLQEAIAANKAIRLELDETRGVFFNDNRLDESRSLAITNIVHQILLDSDNRVNLRGERAMMGWNNGFHLRSADGLFQLNIGGFTQTRYMSRWQGVDDDVGTSYDKWRSSFGQPRTELRFGGHAFGKGLEYFMNMGWGRYDPDNISGTPHTMSFRLWEAWLQFKLTSDFQIKIGQFTLPFTRESLIRPENQLAVEKTTIDHRLGLAESEIVEFDWASDSRRFKLALSNGSGALFHSTIWRNGTDPTPPWAALQRDTIYAVTMRHEWKLLGNWDQFSQFTSPPGSERGVLLGLAGHRQNIELSSPLPISEFPDGVYWTVTGDVTLQYDGASLYAAVIYERLKDFEAIPKSNFIGYLIQGSTYLTNQTEVFVRWEAGGSDTTVQPGGASFGDEELMLLTLGMNHYLDGQDLKFTADVMFSFGEVSLVMQNTQTGIRADKRRFDQIVLRTQLQLMF